MKEKIVFCWSGGKDSALALHRLLVQGRYEVVSLLTTCNEHYQRVSMHGVRIELLEQQARAIGLPLQKMFVSQRSSNEEYSERMKGHLLAFKAQGVTRFAFGDIFLEDLKRWREENLAQLGLRGLFPVWKADSRDLIREFITLGFGWSSAASTTPIWIKRPWAGILMRISSDGCPLTSIPAAKMANSIPLPSPGQSSRNHSESRSAKKSIAQSKKRIRAQRRSQVRCRTSVALKGFGFVIC
jgi:uncharacterized protein (TIGR00290 family)